MISQDIVDVLRREHDRIRRLCTDVRHPASGVSKERAFSALERLVTRHEFADRAVVHPATRDCTPIGDAVGRACLVDEGKIERDLAGLRRLGVGHADFDSAFAGLHQALLDHTAREERDEFPLLRRYVTAQRLHMMVGEAHDVQVMGVG
jgi:hypothetical protein